MTQAISPSRLTLFGLGGAGLLAGITWLVLPSPDLIQTDGTTPAEGVPWQVAVTASTGLIGFVLGAAIEVVGHVRSSARFAASPKHRTRLQHKDTAE